ncbi:MAG: glycosyltransferase [Rhodospirillaceae bacterium]|nr:glycosyltransferase [Rhodospirillaceae bacterium]
MSQPKLLFWVQHLLGIGHLRRAAALTHALAADGFAVTVVSGGMPVPELDLGPVDLIQLAPARAADSSFAGVVDENGRVIDDEWRAARRAQLMAIFDVLKPDLVLIELYPFGRRAFRSELNALLDACKMARIPVFVSLRDLLVDKGRADRVAETVRLVRDHVAKVLVHGDPQFLRLEQSFPAASEIADRIAYTGYVVNRPMSGSAAAPAAAPGGSPARSGTPSPAAAAEVLVSAGGGAVGRRLLETALAARPLTRLADAPWRLVTGPQIPDADFRALAAAAPKGVALERFRADFQQILACCRVSVSQAGYNTLMEILSAGTRSVVVPFADGGESEQTVRARLLAARGLLELVEADALTPASLAAAIDRADEKPRGTGAAAIDLDGARQTAALLRQHLAGRPA